MTLTHKFLDVPDYQKVSDEIYEYVINHTDFLNNDEEFFFYYMDVGKMLDHTPLLQKFLQEKSLHPTMIGIVVTHANSSSNLHADFVDTLTTTYIRMLWPVRNCHGSRTVFYNIPKEYLTIITQDNGIKYYNIPTDQNWEYLDEFELASPVVFDVIIPHEVVTSSDATDHRISCTIGFDKELLLSKSFDAWNTF
jgi:hypothetical protein